MTTAKTYIATSYVMIQSYLDKLQKGDTLLIKDGIYNDIKLSVKLNGDLKNLITIKAENKNVVFKGNSVVELSGSFLHFSGITFDELNKNCSNTVNILGSNNRVSNCSFLNYTFPQDHIVNIQGQYHRVDHCLFKNITQKGLCIFIYRPIVIENYILIDNNKFCDRTNLCNVPNELEIIRIGTSDQSLSSAKCMVVNNSFDNCNGELEIISVKSCNNIVYGNTLTNCYGTITLRHGNKNIICKNSIDGKNKSDSGGIRIVGENHLVSNNLLTNLNSISVTTVPICIVNGQENPELNGYYTPKNCVISDNIILNCSTGFAIGHQLKTDTIVKPSNISLTNNKCYLKKGMEAFSSSARVMFNNTPTFSNNELYVSTLGNIKTNKGLIVNNCTDNCNVDCNCYGISCIFNCENTELKLLYTKLLDLVA